MARRRILLIPGVILILLGATLLWIGLSGLLTRPLAPPLCPVTGCPPISWQSYTTDWIEIISGLAMIAIGTGMIVASRIPPHTAEN